MAGDHGAVLPGQPRWLIGSVDGSPQVGLPGCWKPHFPGTVH
ncbi:hypothetical protein OIE68_33270 [Nocardia vinacea]|nr:hypothetical protein OIE68_33270 [Nocardia vinacea]